MVGLRGSETSRVRVTWYFDEGDPTTTRPSSSQFPGKVVFEGRTELSRLPSVVTCRVTKHIATPYASFVVELKEPVACPFSLMEAMQDDDWIDIEFFRHDKGWHVLRGLVRSITESRSASMAGHERTITVAGECFGRIFVQTPVFFNMWTGDMWSLATAQIWEYYKVFGGNPADVVRALLRGFSTHQLKSDIVITPPLLPLYRKNQQAVFRLPAAMPVQARSGGPPTTTVAATGLLTVVPSTGAPTTSQTGTVTSALYVTNSQTFADAFTIFSGDFDPGRKPQRLGALGPGVVRPHDQSLWSLASEWTDPALGEMFVDLLPPVAQNYDPARTPAVEADFDQPGGPTTFSSFFVAELGLDALVDYPSVGADGLGETSSPGSQHMAVVYRDRPFPDTVAYASVGESVWFTRLPLYTASIEDLAALQLSRSGEVRKNTFFVGSELYQNSVQSAHHFQAPRWDPDSYVAHGIRRYDVSSSYVSTVNDLLTLSNDYRTRVADHHMLDHFWLNGTLDFAMGRPDIRVGSRLRIKYPTGSVTFYVEGVDHKWDLVRGVRTSVVVTRGFFGSDAELSSLLRQTSALFETPFSVSSESAAASPFIPPVAPLAATSIASPVGEDSPYSGQLKQLVHYPPYSTKAAALFENAALTAGLPVTWSDPHSTEGRALHRLLQLESNGYVGIPNFLYWRDDAAAVHHGKSRSWAGWVEIHNLLRAGVANTSGRNADGLTSSATGLGQLLASTTSPNVQTYYPSGLAGIGDPLEEAIGMIRYIQARYGTPVQALAAYTDHY